MPKIRGGKGKATPTNTKKGQYVRHTAFRRTDLSLLELPRV